MKHLHVPQYEDLTIPEFLKFASDYPFVTMCLPDRKQELEKLPRQYLINIIYTKVGDTFKNWVDEKVDERHEKIKEDGNKMVEMDPELYESYKKSKAISTSNGNMHHLFKESTKPRRTKAEIKEARLQEAAEKLEIELKLKRLAEME